MGLRDGVSGGSIDFRFRTGDPLELLRPEASLHDRVVTGSALLDSQARSLYKGVHSGLYTIIPSRALLKLLHFAHVFGYSSKVPISACGRQRLEQYDTVRRSWV